MGDVWDPIMNFIILFFFVSHKIGEHSKAFS